MGNIKYVQLEAGDFLSDPDFQLMTDAERGIYTTVIFYLYDNDGKILNDPNRIKSLTNSGESFEKSWKVVEKKFSEKNGFLTHKRVRKELAKAKRYFQAQRRAGLIGAEKRWAGHSNPNGDAIAKPMANKRKESKTKEKKTKRFVPPTLEEVKQYIKENPELSNVDPNVFWKGFNDGGWIDTKGNPVRNWKLKLRTWSNYGIDKSTQKTRLYPIKGKTCSLDDCNMPAVYKDTSGAYDYYRCQDHLPEKVKEKYS